MRPRRAGEPLEDACHVLGGDAGSGVGDHDGDPPVTARERDRDGVVRPGVFDGVLDDGIERELEPVGVGPRHRLVELPQHPPARHGGPPVRQVHDEGNQVERREAQEVGALQRRQPARPASRRRAADAPR